MYLANAKVNLFLRVQSKRADGYHELETVFLEVNLCDRLTFQKTEQGIEIETLGMSIPEKENIVYQAVMALSKYRTEDHSGLRILLEKEIPSGAGLGGGSSDAATTLVALNQFWRLHLHKETLISIGQTLGADVPFFIKGGLAIGKGKGEILEHYSSQWDLPLIVVYPNLFVSTKQMYEAFDQEQKQQGALKQKSSSMMIQGLMEKDLEKVCENACNDFEEVAIKWMPELQKVKQAILGTGAEIALMSGSGSAFFGIYKNVSLAEKAKLDLSQQYAKTYLVFPVLRESKEVAN